jgi:hypothetical protein
MIERIIIDQVNLEDWPHDGITVDYMVNCHYCGRNEMVYNDEVERHFILIGYYYPNKPNQFRTIIRTCKKRKLNCKNIIKFYN